MPSFFTKRRPVSSRQPPAADPRIQELTGEIARQHEIARLAEQAKQSAWQERSKVLLARQQLIEGFPLGLYYALCQELAVAPSLQPSPYLDRKEESAEEAIRRLDQTALDARAAAFRAAAEIRQIEALAKRARTYPPGPPGSLDAEVAAVAAEYERKQVQITTDEAVGIALARIYARLGGGDAAGARTLLIAARGHFALRETGNCAADAVFDPDLRAAMAEKRRHVRKWTADGVVQAYLEIAALAPEYGTVSAYALKNPERLRDLPEQVLHGLVVCYPSGPNVGHAVRILALEPSGIRVAEGNLDGRLSIGRFVSFRQLAWDGSGRVIAFTRHPCDRHGLDPIGPHSFADPRLYAQLKALLDEVGKFQPLKLVSAEALLRLPDRIRDSLVAYRFRAGKAYDIIHYTDFFSRTRELFPDQAQESLRGAFFRLARCNPTGRMVVSEDLSRGRRVPAGTYRAVSAPLSRDKAKEMVIFWSEEGGEEISLYEASRIREGFAAEHPELAEGISRFFTMTEEAFDALSERAKSALVVLMPRSDRSGRQVIAAPYLEMQQVGLGETEGTVTVVDRGARESVALRDFLDNPLGALVVLDRYYDVGVYVGDSCRLSPEEQRVIESLPVKAWGGEEEIRSQIEWQARRNREVRTGQN